jgi:hypothetical protein
LPFVEFKLCIHKISGAYCLSYMGFSPFKNTKPHFIVRSDIESQIANDQTYFGLKANHSIGRLLGLKAMKASEQSGSC